MASRKSLCPSAGIRVVNAARAVLGFVITSPDRHLQAASGDLVHSDRLLPQHGWVSYGRVGHRGADPDPGRAGCKRRQRRPAFQPGPVWEEIGRKVVEQPGVVKAQHLDVELVLEEVRERPRLSSGNPEARPRAGSVRRGPFHGLLACTNLAEADLDQLLYEPLGERLVNREMQGALRARGGGDVVGQLSKDRTAEGEIAQVVFECGESGDHLALQPKRRNPVRNALFGFGNDALNGLLPDAQPLSRSALKAFAVVTFIDSGSQPAHLG